MMGFSQPGRQRSTKSTSGWALWHEPAKVSESRIKRLRGLSHPQYRLRVEDVRVFYDVAKTSVEILAIVSKTAAEAWLSQTGKPEKQGEQPDEESGTI